MVCNVWLSQSDSGILLADAASFVTSDTTIPFTASTLGMTWNSPDRQWFQVMCQMWKNILPTVVLLASFSNFFCKIHHFWDIYLWKVTWPWNPESFMHSCSNAYAALSLFLALTLFINCRTYTGLVVWILISFAKIFIQLLVWKISLIIFILSE